MKDFYKYAAEVIGTFFLAAIVGLSVGGVFPISTPVLASVTLLVFVYTIGNISGSNINPAVSLGLLSRSAIGLKDVIVYVLLQLLVGFFVAYMLNRMGVDINVENITGSKIFIAEALGAGIFGFGIMSVVRQKVDDDMSGMVIGGSLFLGIAVAVLFGSVGALNPAIAIALGIASFEYLIAPIVGMVLGMLVYDFLIGKKPIGRRVTSK